MFKIDANNAVEIEKKAGAETDYAENPAYSNCKNCAAPLRSSKCEYCGTEYGTVTINGETIKVYVKYILYSGSCHYCQDVNGKMHRTFQEKRTFTLVEI